MCLPIYLLSIYPPSSISSTFHYSIFHYFPAPSLIQSFPLHSFLPPLLLLSVPTLHSPSIFLYQFSFILPRNTALFSFLPSLPIFSLTLSPFPFRTLFFSLNQILLFNLLILPPFSFSSGFPTLSFPTFIPNSPPLPSVQPRFLTFPPCFINSLSPPYSTSHYSTTYSYSLFLPLYQLPFPVRSSTFLPYFSSLPYQLPICTLLHLSLLHLLLLSLSLPAFISTRLSCPQFNFLSLLFLPALSIPSPPYSTSHYSTTYSYSRFLPLYQLPFPSPHDHSFTSSSTASRHTRPCSTYSRHL